MSGKYQIRGPIDIGRIIKLEGREIIGYELSVRDIPGALAEVSRVFADQNVNIVHVLVVQRVSESLVKMVIFADLTDREELIERLSEELRSRRKFVVHVNTFRKQHPEFIGDVFHYPLTIMGEIVVGFREPILRGLLETFKEKVGPEGTKIFLWHAGFSCGKRASRSYASLKVKGIKDLITLIKLFSTALGWGVIGEVSIKDNKIIMQVLRNWECELLEEVKGPRSHFIRGIFAGIFTEFLGRDVKVRESKCIGMGEPYCEFIIEF